MEETLGKRISFHRKRLGLTQDALAGKMDVTAQAVSKWENDQSCPDITTLPKLARLFGITTDALLGLEQSPDAGVRPSVPQEDGTLDETEGLAGKWELTYHSPRRTDIAVAAWVLLAGVLQLLVILNQWGVPGFWEILWSSGLLIFGLMGLYPRFSFFRLGCGLFAGFYLLSAFDIFTFPNAKQLILPVLLLLFGLSLLFDMGKKGAHNEKSGLTIRHNGKAVASNRDNSCRYQDGSFFCTNSFGEHDYLIQLSQLTGGSAKSSFGALQVDLSGCESVAEGCEVTLNSAFGDLEVLVPRRYRIEFTESSSFGSVEIKGQSAPETVGTIFFTCEASFGQITLRYI